MDTFLVSVQKSSPQELFNLLLKLNQDHKKISPENKVEIDALNEKIALVQDRISLLKFSDNENTDTSPASSVDRDKMVRSRGGNLAQITSLIKKFDSTYDSLTVDSTEDERTNILIDLEQLVSSLAHQLGQAENKTVKLETLSDEDFINDLIEKNASYSDKIFLCKSKLKALKDQQKIRLQQQSKACLPNITIAKFVPKAKGSYAEFQQFKASFEALFLQTNLYSQVQLFNYLLSYLAGPAKDIVSRYSLQQDFTLAYKELCDCFDRPQLLISECLETLDLLEKPYGNAQSLRPLFSKQNQAVALLFRFIGGTVMVDKSVLMLSLMEKVPFNFDKAYRDYLLEQETQRQKDLQIVSLTRDIQALSNAVGHSSVGTFQPPTVRNTPFGSNVESYFAFFERYLNNLEYLEALHPRIKKGNEDERPKHRPRQPKTESGTNLAISAKTPKSWDKKGAKGGQKFCFLCREKSHYTSECKKEMGVKKRWDIFIKNKLCFNCGRKFHSSKNCKNEGACTLCKIKHLPLLHYTPNSGPDDTLALTHE